MPCKSLLYSLKIPYNVSLCTNKATPVYIHFISSNFYEHIRKLTSQELLKPFQQLLDYVFTGIFVAFNIVALVICYFYIKQCKRQKTFLFDGYIAIFRTFAEFVSPAVCFIYGIIDMEVFYLAGGAFGILLGFMIRTLLYLCHRGSISGNMSSFIIMFTGIYILTVYLCCWGFYNIILKCGAVHCASGIVTFVIPMMAFSESVRYRISDSFLLASMVDIIAVAILCSFCAHVSVKYFFILPNLVGIILVAVESLSVKILKVIEDKVAYYDVASESGGDTSSEIKKLR